MTNTVLNEEGPSTRSLPLRIKEKKFLNNTLFVRSSLASKNTLTNAK